MLAESYEGSYDHQKICLNRSWWGYCQRLWEDRHVVHLSWSLTALLVKDTKLSLHVHLFVHYS